MRVLQINAVYKTKSTGRIAMEMHKYFQSQGIESYVAYATENTDTSNDANVFRIGNVIDHKLHALAYRIDHMQGCHSSMATRRLINKIREMKPDVVITHNLHSNYINAIMLLEELKKSSIPTIICLHDCWWYTGGCYHYTALGCYQWRTGCQHCPTLGRAAKRKYEMLEELYMQTRPTVLATSHWIECEAKASLIGKYCQVEMIYDWIDRSVFYQRNDDKIRYKYNIGNKRIILGVATNWDENKGKHEIATVAKAFPDDQIIIVGHQVGTCAYPSNVLTIAFTESKDELAQLYSAADVFFTPSKQETFGLVSGEALACGTPIVAYNVTACPEFIDEYTGEIIGEDGISQAIQRVFQKYDKKGKDFISQKCVEFAAKNFDIDTNIHKYIELCSMVGSKK